MWKIKKIWRKVGEKGEIVWFSTVWYSVCGAENRGTMTHLQAGIKNEQCNARNCHLNKGGFGVRDSC